MRVLPHGMMDVLRQGNLGALVLPLIFLGAGWSARGLLVRKTVAYSWHGVTLARPAGWTVAAGERSAADATDGDSVVLMDLLGPGRIKPRVTLRVGPLPEAALPNPHAAAAALAAPAAPESPEPAARASNDREPALADATVTADTTDVAPVVAPAIAETLANRLPLYYAMDAQQTTISGAPATRVDSAFAFTPPPVPGRKGDIPVVMRAIDLVVLRAYDALSIQVAAPIEDFEAQRPTLEAIVASLRMETPTEDEPPPGAPDSPPPADAPSAGAVTVAGQVVDADSGLAVPGAIVLFLTPGTVVADVTDDSLPESTYTSGLADSGGHFASTRALDRPARYPVMVVADGYHWIGSDDGVAVEDETPIRLDVGAVRLRRR
ncbi:MAG: hypothetical protein ABUL77_01420 [Bacteroidota bacterium]